MPKFNADTCFEQIEITFNDRIYKVGQVTEKMLEDVQEIATKEDADDADATIMDRQLALFLGVSTDDFKGQDIRIKSRIIKFITQTVRAQMNGTDEAGNVAGNAPRG